MLNSWKACQSGSNINKGTRAAQMNEKRDIWISARAYALWEENGRIDGSDHEHWLQAVREYELMMETRALPDGSEILASRKVKETR